MPVDTDKSIRHQEKYPISIWILRIDISRNVLVAWNYSYLFESTIKRRGTPSTAVNLERRFSWFIRGKTCMNNCDSCVTQTNATNHAMFLRERSKKLNTDKTICYRYKGLQYRHGIPYRLIPVHVCLLSQTFQLSIRTPADLKCSQ
jgi:hypothetical protein